MGQFYEPFSMDMFCSTSDMHFPQVAGVTCAFGISRRIGLLYAYDDKKYSLSLGLSVYTKLSNAFYRKMCKEYAKVKEEQPKLGYEYMLLTMSKMFIPVHMLKIDGL